MGKTNVLEHSQNVGLDLAITLSWQPQFLEFPHQRTLSYTKFLTCDIIFKAYMRCWSTILFPKMHNINWKSGIQYRAKTLWKVHYARVASLMNSCFFFPFQILPIGDKKIDFSNFSANSANFVKILKKILKIQTAKLTHTWCLGPRIKCHIQDAWLIVFHGSHINIKLTVKITI